MGVAKCSIKGSDYVGVFATTTNEYTFLCDDAGRVVESLILHNLGTKIVPLSIGGTDMVGLFLKANSNGIVVSNIIERHELERLKKSVGINVEVINSNLNAVGNNIMVNNKIAVINPEYDVKIAGQIRDALGVEVIREETDGFKTVGANNMLTDKGFVINNRATDTQKERLDKSTGFDSIRTTANTGSLGIGISVLANANGALIGNSTTGYELSRIMEALDLE
ncbi:MAG: translation initiation factor IF-6 [Candidatus Marsarchaeota archaeon]|nr:translation initiation factor IF-6 [Candidatus Marsarchaeota archaeon]